MTGTKKFGDFGKLLLNILLYRQSNNIKQTSIGREIGLTQKQYSRIESGDVQLKLQVFLQIAHALNMNPCDLLEESGILEGFAPGKKSEHINRLEARIAELEEHNSFLKDVIHKLDPMNEFKLPSE